MATFLLEVGTEELPASFVSDAQAQWRSRIPESLAEQFLTPDSIQIYGTPRRLAVLIAGLPDRQPDREEEIKGPPAKAAFKDGKPTKAGEGFMRSKNVTLDDLEIRETDKGEFVFVVQKITGRPTADILTELVPNWILGLEGKRFMRWGDGDLKFPRPIRWLVTLLEDQVLPITLVNGSETCVSDRLSQGHRVLHPDPIPLPSATDYLKSLSAAYVEVDTDQRRQRIQTQANAAAKSVKGVAAINPDLLEEVTDLVEWGTAVVGKFDPDFLELPPQVITSEMESHQRYFPVLKKAGSAELLPCFITISNGDPAKSDVIAAGNERVLRARLSDGKFFFDADRTIPLEGYLEKLESVTFQKDLGSVRQKVDRIVYVSNLIADQLQVSKGDRTQIQRTALLCKADLVTQMVGEFPELQGVMGQKYALTSGEAAIVADGIFEHYLPRGAGDILPKTLTGQVVGLGDRLDTLVSIFGLGMIPSGSSDPFALRRAANAVVNITWAGDLAINLSDLLTHTVQTFVEKVHQTDGQALLSQLKDFFIQRIRTLLQDELSIDYDLVNAVLGEEDPEYTERALVNVRDVRDRAQFLQSIRNNKTLEQIYETVNRASRLAAQGELDTQQLDPKSVVDAKLFQQPSEQAFYDALVILLPKTQTAQSDRNYQSLVDALTDSVTVVSNFFDGSQSVLVMDKDPDIRRNRLNLLGVLRNQARVLADFGAIVKQ